MTLERRGIPAVGIVTDHFSTSVINMVDDQGMPHIRFAFVDHPVAFQTAEICRNKIYDYDPIHESLFLEQIYTGLFDPLTEEEAWTGTRPEQWPERYMKPDTAANLQQIFYDLGMTDGLPIVLPTEEKVAKMLSGTSRNPEDIVGRLRPSVNHAWRTFNVEQVAVNAVMAGAKPEYFPVILAIASAELESLFASTNSWANMTVVSGPIAQEIELEGGLGAMGPWYMANSTIGRAYTLLSKNLAGCKLANPYNGCQGNNFNYNNITFAENTIKLPEGWDPLHVMYGYKPEESVVFIFRGLSLRQPSGVAGAYGSPEHLSNAVNTLYATGPMGWLCGTILIDPILAADLKDIYGIESRQELMELLHKNTPHTQSSFFRLYPNLREQGEMGAEPFATWLSYGPDENVPVSRFSWDEKYGGYGEPPRTVRAPNLDVIVMGGSSNIWYYFGDFGKLTEAPIDEWR